jgi:hypothetical protein
MRYKRAVEKLRVLAEACERVKMFWFDTEPFCPRRKSRGNPARRHRLAGERVAAQ